MKKRLLITSIVMMLVVAVALSTATYAWFTSNATVKASSINVTAATNQDSALAIGWTNGNAGTVIVANDPAAALAPMAPEHLVNLATTDAVNFYSATVKSENSVEVFNNDVSSTIQPYTFSSAAGVGSFYIKNLSMQNVVDNIRVTLDWGDTAYEVVSTGVFAEGKTYYKKNTTTGAYEALVVGEAEGNYQVGGSIPEFGSTVYIASNKSDGSSLIRVAVFAKQADESDYTLRGVLAKGVTAGDPYTATIANKTNATNGTLNIVSQKPTADCAQVATTQEVYLLKADTNLAANSTVSVIVKVWYDGVTLNDTTAGSIANLGLIFDKAADPTPAAEPSGD